jgi:hypothetical protein
VVSQSLQARHRSDTRTDQSRALLVCRLVPVNADLDAHYHSRTRPRDSSCDADISVLICSSMNDWAIMLSVNSGVAVPQIILVSWQIPSAQPRDSQRFGRGMDDRENTQCRVLSILHELQLLGFEGECSLDALSSKSLIATTLTAL